MVWRENIASGERRPASERPSAVSLVREAGERVTASVHFVSDRVDYREFAIQHSRQGNSLALLLRQLEVGVQHPLARRVGIGPKNQITLSRNCGFLLVTGRNLVAGQVSALVGNKHTAKVDRRSAIVVDFNPVVVFPIVVDILLVGDTDFVEVEFYIVGRPGRVFLENSL